MSISRRLMLLGAGSAALLAGLPWAVGIGAPVQISAERRVIDVRGRAAGVSGLRQLDGTHGARFAAGSRFQVALTNRLPEPTLIHWHGLRPPVEQDGVPGVSQPLLPPGGAHGYDFALRESGTYWMHAHHGLQEQTLLAAPLIVEDGEGRDEQEVVLMLHDFSFRDPAEIFASLTSSGMQPAGAAGGHAGHGQAAAGVPHLNDVEFDAYLANDRTLADPEVVTVERGGQVRLRIINGASSTNFWIELGALVGELIAVDGRPVHPVMGSRFGLAMSQRIDLRLRLPSPGAFPLLAVREGDRRATGLVLRTPGAPVARLEENLAEAAPALFALEEERLRALNPLAERPADRRLTIALTEAEAAYGWGMGGEVAGAMREYEIAAGERVEIVFENRTGMSHPMHLHGHAFQVMEMNGRRFAGAVRDTVLVPHQGRVTIAFDADNPGAWMAHCHNLYHMAAGMMALLRYS